MSISDEDIEEIDKFIGCKVKKSNEIDEVGIIDKKNLRKDITEELDPNLVKRSDIIKLIKPHNYKESKVENYLEGNTDSIDEGDFETIYTAYIDNDEWHKGAEVLRYDQNGEDFIKTENNGKRADNLNQACPCECLLKS